MLLMMAASAFGLGRRC